MISPQPCPSAVFTPLPVRPRQSGKRPEALWYALYLPQLRALPAARRHRCLLAVARLMRNYSADIRLDETALICEVRSALRYFGGAAVIHEKLGADVRPRLRQWELPEEFCHAAAPTITGSLLLARGGGGKAVYQRADLQAALRELPVSVLMPDRQQDRRLRNMGIRHLRDLWRLPVDGLVTRFGEGFVKQLDRALGKAPETTRKYLAPPSFQSGVELPCESLELDRLLPAAEELLKRLCDFLFMNDLATSRLHFSLRHGQGREQGREQRRATQVRIELRRPGRCRKHFLMLLQTRLGELSLSAPVTALHLAVNRFEAYLDRDLQLLRNHKAAGADDAGLDHLLEQLRAKLGEGRVRGIEVVADHRPECASRDFDYFEGGGTGSNTPVAGSPRPLWVLPEPRRLACHEGKPLHHGPIALLSGPERIESGWWSGEDIRRDYYIAGEVDGGRLWIYRERGGDRHWYLHGYFA